MADVYQKGVKTKLTEHFYSTHFDCHCTRPICKDTLVDEDLVNALEEYWELTGGFVIDSGFRCMEHNAEIKGVPDSQHLLGKAADCRSLLSYNGNLMARMAEKVDALRKGGIGIYPGFCHVDVRKGPARWSMPAVC